MHFVAILETGASTPSRGIPGLHRVIIVVQDRRSARTPLTSRSLAVSGGRRPAVRVVPPVHTPARNPYIATSPSRGRCETRSSSNGDGTVSGRSCNPPGDSGELLRARAST